MCQNLSLKMHEIIPASGFTGLKIRKTYSCYFLCKSMTSLKILILVLITAGITNPLQAQTAIETTTIDKDSHSPKKASIYSAVLPGLGQAYNKKYWKMPIIYAGFGTIYYITRTNTLEYRKFLEAYQYVANKDTVPINNEYVHRYSQQQLMLGKNHYRRNLEIGYIVGGAFYILNIIDAAVDAHLFNYDVSDNLSLNIEPIMLRDPIANRHVTGLGLTFKF